MRSRHSWLLCLASICWLAANVPPCPAQEATLELLWQDLASNNAETAHRAIWALALKPEQTIPFMKACLQPVSGERKHIDQLIRDLDSGSFAAREKAGAELERLEDGAEEALKDALKANPGIELKRRVESLLARLPDMTATPERVRHYRALEVLEAIGTKEAQAILDKLAKGNSPARWTQMARVSRERLACRPKLEPMPARKSDEFGDDLPTGVLARLGTSRFQSGAWAAVTPDGKSLVAVSEMSLQMWDLATGQPLSGFPQLKNIPGCTTAAISPDGKLLAVVHKFRYGFDIYELPSGKRRFRKNADEDRIGYGYYCHAAFARDSKTFCLSNQYDIAYWDMETGQKKHEFTDPEGYHYIAAISSDAEKMVTTHRDGTQVRHLATGKVVKSLVDSEGLVQRFELSANGATFAATYGFEKCVYFWDTVTGKPVGEIELNADRMHGDQLASFAMSPDGNTLAVCDCVRKGDSEQHIQIWNLADLNAKPRILAPPPGVGRLVRFAPDGKTLLWRIGDSYRLLDVTKGKDCHGWASRGSVLGVAWSPDGTRIATAGLDGTVTLWEAGTGKQLHTLVGHRGSLGRVVFSPDSKLLVSCGAHKEPAILWDAATGQKKVVFDNNRTKLAGVDWAGFSPDGKQLFTSGFGGNAVFEIPSGKQLGSTFDTGGVSTWNMAFSANGLYARGSEGLHVFDLIAKTRRHILEIRQCVAHAFSFDGRMVAGLNSIGEVRIWEMATGRERMRFTMTKSYAPYGQLAFSGDGRFLGAVGHIWNSQNQFEVWDLATRRQLLPFSGHIDSVTAVAFSPDSKLIATASRDGTVLIHPIDLTSQLTKRP